VIDRALLEAHPVDVARMLLGSVLISEVGSPATLRITEVEAYAADDPASHSFRGRTPRNGSMFDKPGTLYVYRSYGIHWCANVVTGVEGVGAAVLLRAGEPIAGRSVMIGRRGRDDHIADGPGKLCQAMGIEGAHDGVDLLDPASPLRLVPGEAPVRVRTTPRIGISKAVDLPWRFLGEPDQPGH
jgi:DNA-3-methyladenine glycosylase